MPEWRQSFQNFFQSLGAYPPLPPAPSPRWLMMPGSFRIFQTVGPHITSRSLKYTLCLTKATHFQTQISYLDFDSNLTTLGSPLLYNRSRKSHRGENVLMYIEMYIERCFYFMIIVVKTKQLNSYFLQLTTSHLSNTLKRRMFLFAVDQGERMRRKREQTGFKRRIYRRIPANVDG